MNKIFVTGAAGFIGSNLVDRLLREGKEVVGWDNFSTGQRRFLNEALKNPKFTFIEGDTLDLPKMSQAMMGCDFVVHFAANADVRFGTHHPSKDLQQNTIATFNVLEAMRLSSVRRIAFSSTGSIYGDSSIIPTPENSPFPIQTSLYGASKLAGEGLIQAYAEGFGFEGYIFRFVSILGQRYTHGHVFDFYKQLLRHPTHLDVLGDGLQKKSYLDIDDCISAILYVIQQGTAAKARHRIEIYNLGTPEYCELNQSIQWICDYLGVHAEIRYSGGKQGWIGDNPFIFLDTTKIRSTGWSASTTIHQGVINTLQWLQNNHWVLEKR